MFDDIFLLVSIALVAAVIYWYLSMPRNLPPGPFGWPFVGVIIDRKNPCRQMKYFSEKYGSPVVSFYVYNRLLVAINEGRVVREAMTKLGHKINNRGTLHNKGILVNDEIIRGNYGLLFPNGALWKEQRHFAQCTLKDLGAGKPVLENAILEEVEALTQALHETKCQPFNLEPVIMLAVANIVAQLVFGKRYDYSDTEISEFLSREERVSSVPHPIILASLVFLKRWMWCFIPGVTAKLDEMQRDVRLRWKYIMNHIIEHRETHRPEDEPRDYIHAFLKKQEQEKSEHSTFSEAAIQESLRLGSTVPMIGRTLSEDADISGYSVPKGTAVWSNVWGINHDRKNYTQPDKFMPERFIGSDGMLIKDKAHLPFGIGKRNCVGESLAKMELFLFFSGVIQRFCLSIPSDHPEPSVEPVVGLTMHPQPFRVIATPRPS